MEDIIFCGLNLGAWVTIVTVLSMFATLLLTKLREDIAFLGVIAILLLTGVLDTKEALSGFSSGSVVVIGVLFAVLAGLVHTGVLQWSVRYLLGTPKNYSAAVVRLMLPVAALSSILSNTTVVAHCRVKFSKCMFSTPSMLITYLSSTEGAGVYVKIVWLLSAASPTNLM